MGMHQETEHSAERQVIASINEQDLEFCRDDASKGKLNFLSSALESHAILLLIVVIAVLLRLWLLWQAGTRLGLSVDELQSAVHAFQSPLELLQSVREKDPHPPLYYLQLHLWMKLGVSDLWLQLNSLLLSTLAVPSLYFTTRVLFEKRRALLASLLLAINPFIIAAGIEVRMYSMLVLVGIWQWFFTHQYVLSARRHLYGVGLLIASLLLLATHGTAILLWMSSFLYGSFLLARSPNRQPGKLKGWLLLHGMVLIPYLPWAYRISSVNLTHLARPDIPELAYTITQLLWGPKSVLLPLSGVLPAFSLIAFIVGCLCLLLSRQGRLSILFYVLFPLVIAFVISYLAKPIWATRALIFILPFFFLAFSLAASSWLFHNSGRKKLASRVMLSLFIMASLSAVLYQTFNYPPWSHLKEPVAFVRSELMSGDVIYVPNERMYWGWTWYFAGPGRMTPLRESEVLLVDGVLVLGGTAIEGELTTRSRYWIIHRQSFPAEPFDSMNVEMNREVQATFRNVLVETVVLYALPVVQEGQQRQGSTPPAPANGELDLKAEDKD